MSLTELRDDIQLIYISYKPCKQMRTAQGSVMSCWSPQCRFVPNQVRMRYSPGNPTKLFLDMVPSSTRTVGPQALREYFLAR